MQRTGIHEKMAGTKYREMGNLLGRPTQRLEYAGVISCTELKLNVTEVNSLRHGYKSKGGNIIG